MEGFKSMMTDIYKQWHVLDMSCLYLSIQNATIRTYILKCTDNVHETLLSKILVLLLLYK